MNLGAFHTKIRDVIKRGTRVDTQIVDATREAARFIEQNFTLKYMEQYRTFQLDADSGQPRYMPAPNARVKNYDLIRLYVTSIAEWHDLSLRDARSVKTSLTPALPDLYWLQGKTGIWLNCPPDLDYDGEMVTNEFTLWPTDETTENIWLIDHAFDVLKAQTLVKLSPELRDPKLKTEYEEVFKEGIKTLLLSETDLKESNKSETQNYGVDYSQQTSGR